MSTENTNEPKDVIADYANELNQIQMVEYERTVRKARNALYWAGGLIFAGEMLSMILLGEFSIIIFLIAVAEGGIFIALALWTKTKPYSAIVTGLIVFIGLIVFAVVLNGILVGPEEAGKALGRGIVVKIIILVNLIRPLKDAKALQEAKRQSF